MSSKLYPEEFKFEAVKQVVERGDSVTRYKGRLDIAGQEQQTTIAIIISIFYFILFQHVKIQENEVYND